MEPSNTNDQRFRDERGEGSRPASLDTHARDATVNTDVAEAIQGFNDQRDELAFAEEVERDRDFFEKMGFDLKPGDIQGDAAFRKAFLEDAEKRRGWSAAMADVFAGSIGLATARDRPRRRSPL